MAVFFSIKFTTLGEQRGGMRISWIILADARRRWNVTFCRRQTPKGGGNHKKGSLRVDQIDIRRVAILLLCVVKMHLWRNRFRNDSGAGYRSRVGNVQNGLAYIIISDHWTASIQVLMTYTKVILSNERMSATHHTNVGFAVFGRVIKTLSCATIRKRSWDSGIMESWNNQSKALPDLLSAQSALDKGYTYSVVMGLAGHLGFSCLIDVVRSISTAKNDVYPATRYLLRKQVQCLIFSLHDHTNDLLRSCLVVKFCIFNLWIPDTFFILQCKLEEQCFSFRFHSNTRPARQTEQSLL